jgi:FtsZ-binding cell division protein ZapB
MNHKLYRISFDIKGNGVTVSVVSDSYLMAIERAALKCLEYAGDQPKGEFLEDRIVGVTTEAVEMASFVSPEALSVGQRLNDIDLMEELEEENNRLKEELKESVGEASSRLSMEEALELQESLNSCVMEVERLKERNETLVTGRSQLRNEVSYLTKEIDRLQEKEAIEPIDSIESSKEDGYVSVSTDKGDNHVAQS